MLKRALEIKESKLGPEHLNVAYTLYQMGRWVQEVGRPGEEALLRRALKIDEAKPGGDHVHVGLHDGGRGSAVSASAGCHEGQFGADDVARDA